MEGLCFRRNGALAHRNTLDAGARHDRSMILNPSFRYEPSYATDIRTTFERKAGSQ